MYKVCIDIGGTFTDCVVLDESGDLFQCKANTTPHDLSIGLMNSFGKAAARYGMTTKEFLGQTQTIVHGTTVALNALLMRAGAKTALIATKGFRDISEMRMGLRNINTSMYNMFIPPVDPIVPRRYRYTVEERTKYTGEIITELNEDELRSIIQDIKKEQIEAVAVCFLHSYANPENERRAAEICRQELGGSVYVCASSDIIQIVGEFERESTAILNAYVGPIVSRYFANIDSKLKEHGFAGQLLIMQADAMVQSVTEAVKKPVCLLNSGPASGPSGALFIGEQIGKKNIITIDMGGTSLDIGFVKNGQINLSRRRWIGEEMVAVKMVDIATLGTGGGSLSWFDSLDMLRVGPKSAGADPGPVCYGKGGAQIALTDADLALGYIPEDYFLGGAIPLDASLARAELSKIADKLNTTVEQAAQTVFSIANSNMADAISLVTTKNGHDVRDFSLFALGGAGSTHAAFLAESLGIPEVIVSPFASSFCAWSMFTLDIGRDYLRSCVAPAKGADIDLINQLYQEMIDEALQEFAAFGVGRDDLEIQKSMEFRYKAQFHDVEVGGVPDKVLTAEDFNNVVESFHKRYEEIYVYSLSFYEAELRSLGLTVKIKKKDEIKIKEIAAGTADASAALKRQRECLFNGKYVQTPVYDSEKLKANNYITGPAIIEVPTTTVVVPEAWDCEVDKFGNYIIRRVR